MNLFFLRKDIKVLLIYMYVNIHVSVAILCRLELLPLMVVCSFPPPVRVQT